MKTLLLFLDAGENTGLGHWYRCMALSRVLRSDVNLLWVTPPLAPVLQQALRERKQEWLEVADWSVEKVSALLEKQATPADGFILDLIATQSPLVRYLKSLGTVLSIGGAGPGRDEVDVRIDGMMPRADFHAGFTGRELHLGPEFVILRENFTAAVPKQPAAILEKVLITLGGDAKGVGWELALQCAERIKPLAFDVIVGPLYDGAGSGEPASLVLHKAPGDILPLLQSADVVICSGGMTAYECCRLGLPMILFPLTPLQREAACAMVREGVALLAENTDEICAALRQFQDQTARLKLSTRGQTLVDGNGLHRVASVIKKTFLN